MRIHLHVGLETCGATSLQHSLARNRAVLAAQGILYPLAPGKRNHARLAMACTDPGRPDNLRLARGLASPEAQAAMRGKLLADLADEIGSARPHTMILSNEHCSSRLLAAGEVSRLRDLCRNFSDDISVHFCLRRQSALTAEVFSEQVRQGRTRRLDEDFKGQERGWRDQMLAGIAAHGRVGLRSSAETQMTPAWLDYDRLLGLWEDAFGKPAIRLHAFLPETETEDGFLSAMVAEMGVDGDSIAWAHRQGPSLGLEQAERLRLCNIALHMRQLAFTPSGNRARNAIAAEFAIETAVASQHYMQAIDSQFANSNRALMARFPDLPADLLVVAAEVVSLEPLASGIFDAEAAVERALLPLAGRASAKRERRYFDPVPPAGGWARSAAVPANVPRKGSTGFVLVATMRDEAPFLLEWLAHHRAAGVNNFLIFTNDCADGTDAMLDRLQELGLVTHVRNKVSDGGIPHQEALNQARNHAVVRKSDWIIHIDADEFINVHVGNGTLGELVAAAGEANFISMTWRLFGCNAIHEFADRPVVSQFTAAAPANLPKPHTAWGFKTMYRNIGAYRKLGVHRPNKLNEAKRGEIRWVNGSGESMPPVTVDDGWRSDRNSIGYQLVSLNHYAVRSAEAFMVKRARGRANHASRTLGLNYWIRMDFNSVAEPSMLRHLPRIEAGVAELLGDAELARLQRAAVAWYQKRIAELKLVPEFAEMLAEIKALKLTDAQRVRRSLEILSHGDA